MIRQEGRYVSYLLRMWQGQSGGERVWRASLESPRTGERWGFAALDDLLGFLREHIELPPEAIEARASSEEGGSEGDTTLIDVLVRMFLER